MDLRLHTTSSGLQDVGTRDGLRILVQAYVAWQVQGDADNMNLDRWRKARMCQYAWQDMTCGIPGHGSLLACQFDVDCDLVCLRQGPHHSLHLQQCFKAEGFIVLLRIS